MNVFGLSGILVCLLTMLIAIIVLLTGKDRIVSYTWAALCILVSLWGAGAYMISSTQDKDVAMVLWQITYVPLTFVPLTYFHCILSMLKINRKYFGSLMIVIGRCWHEFGQLTG